MTTKVRLFAGFALALAAAPAAWSADKPTPIQIEDVKHDGPVDFEKTILPIFRQKCLACHNASTAESDLVLETPQTVLKGGGEGPAAVAGKSAESLLLQLAAWQKEPVMPPAKNDVGAKPLTPRELGLVKLWIDQGAKGEVKGAGMVQWQPLPQGVNPIYAVAISPDGQYAAAGRANQIFLHHVPSKRELGRLTDPEILKTGVYTQPGVADLDLIQALAFSPDNLTLASGAYRNAKIWRREPSPKIADWPGVEGAAQSLATSADGKWAAVGQANGAIRLVEQATGKVAQTLTGHTGAVSGLAFSADGAQLLSGGQDKTLRLWTVADGKPIGAPLETPAAVNAAAFATQDKQVLAGQADNMIRLWDVAAIAAPPAPAEGQAAAPPAPVKQFAGHGGAVTALAAFDTGNQFLSGSADGSARVWNVASGAMVRQYAHGGPITAVAIRANGSRAVTAGANKLAKLWADNGQAVSDLKGDYRARVQVDEITRALNLAQRQVATAKAELEAAKKRKTDEEANAKKADENKTKAEADFKTKDDASKKPTADKDEAEKALAAATEVFTKAEAAKKAADDAQKAAADALAKVDADKKTADAGADQGAKDAAAQALADAQAQKKTADEAKTKADQEFNKANTDKTAAQNKLNQVMGPYKTAADARDSAERAMQASVRSVERAKQAVQQATDAIPVAENVVKQTEQGQTDTNARLEAAKKAAVDGEMAYLGVAISADGATAALVGDDQLVSTWDAETGVPLDVYRGQGAKTVKAAFTAAGDVVAAGENGSLVVWDVAPEWKLVRTIGQDRFADRVTALHFSHDGKWLATGGGEPSRGGELMIWDVATGQLVREIPEAHSDTVFALEFSPDNKTIASCAADRFVKTFDVATGKFLRSFEGHTHHVLGVTWSDDGRTLVSSGADKVLKVWDFVTGDQKRTIQGFNKELTAVRFASDGVTVVASCGDQNVHVRRADNGGTVRTLGGGGDYLYSVGISGDAKLVVGGGQDSVFRVWRNDNGQLHAQFAPPAPPATTEPPK